MPPSFAGSWTYTSYVLVRTGTLMLYLYIPLSRAHSLYGYGYAIAPPPRPTETTATDLLSIIIVKNGLPQYTARAPDKSEPQQP